MAAMLGPSVRSHLEMDRGISSSIDIEQSCVGVWKFIDNLVHQVFQSDSSPKMGLKIREFVSRCHNFQSEGGRDTNIFDVVTLVP